MASTFNDELFARVVLASIQASERIMRRDGVLPPLGIAFLGEAVDGQVVNPLEEEGAQDLDGERLRERVHRRLCAIAGRRDDVVAVSTLLYRRDRGRVHVQVEFPGAMLQPLAFPVARVNGVWTVSDSWEPFPHRIAASVLAR